jgi:hypothetical protein
MPKPTDQDIDRVIGGIIFGLLHCSVVAIAAQRMRQGDDSQQKERADHQAR